MMAVKGVLFTVLNRITEFIGINKVDGSFFFNRIGLSLGNHLWNCSVQHYCYPFGCTSLVGVKQVASADLNV